MVKMFQTSVPRLRRVNIPWLNLQFQFIAAKRLSFKNAFSALSEQNCVVCIDKITIGVGRKQLKIEN